MNAREINLSFRALVRYLKYRKLPKAMGERCIIAGNGPSLKTSFEQHLSILQEVPLLCVNHFADTPEFVKLKPHYYCMIDPTLFLVQLPDEREKRRRTLFENLNSLTTWDMHLFFPFRPGQIILEDCLSSPHLHLHSCNIYPGFTWPWIRNHVYRTGLFMPPAQNVLIAATFQAINMGYKEIYLLGAEHSWSEDIRVKDDNVVYIMHNHFFGEPVETPLYKAAPRDHETVKVDELFQALRRTFKSYWYLKEYAASRGAVVYNSTPGSYIDAFERRALSSLR